MNNTEKKEKLEIENLIEIQNLVKTNALANLIVNTKKSRSKIEQYIQVLKEKSASVSVNKSEKKEPVETLVKEEPKPTVKVKTDPVVPVISPEQAKAKEMRLNQNMNRSKIRNFDNSQEKNYNQNRQDFRQKPNTSYQGQRDFRNQNPKDKNSSFNKPINKQGAFQQNKTQNTRPQVRPVTPTLDVSELAKNNTHSKKKVFVKDKPADEKKSMNKKALVMRGYVEDESVYDENVVVARKKAKKVKEQATIIAPKIDHAIITTDNLTVKILSEATGRSVPEIMGKFLMLGMVVNINSNIDFEAAELVASELGVTLEKKLEKTYEEKVVELHNQEIDKESDLVKRPPVVTVMGHVDHGKTSLLDRIRKTNVTQGEAGGITQHIGAYTIQVNGESVTFIDTPGHAAFGAMRERGAQLTDVAILVVAADDGVMPQTVEAIKYIKAAKVPMIVAINKIDVQTANPDRIMQQLTEYDVIPEEWGGDAIIVPISAKVGTNMDKLLDMVLFVAEYQNLKANPKRKASGSIIEARLDKGMGSVATVLVQNGTLNIGDNIVVGTCSGKVRAMINDKGAHVKKAGPSTPVQILGLTGVPNAGDTLYAVDSELAKLVAAERVEKERKSMIKSADLSMDSLLNKIADANYKDYNVIIKADVQGSLEALIESLGSIKNEEVKVRPIHCGVGSINENDVMMASASNAVIIGFNVKPDFKAKVIAEKSKIDIKFYKIIYEAIDFVTKKIDTMKAPKFKEVVTGHAEIRMVFKASKVGQIAGTYVLDGKISKNSKVRVYRKDKLLFEGNIATLQREKNEAKEVNAGYECGVVFDGFSDFVVGDTFETYNLEKIN